jgi:hypothetical protein
MIVPALAVPGYPQDRGRLNRNNLRPTSDTGAAEIINGVSIWSGWKLIKTLVHSSPITPY